MAFVERASAILVIPALETGITGRLSEKIKGYVHKGLKEGTKKGAENKAKKNGGIHHCKLRSPRQLIIFKP
jgi:hypothetical protein